MLFAKRLKSLRTQHHYTQADLADKIGINRATVAGYETGKKQPNFEILIKLAEVFNVSTDFLLGLQDETTQEKLQKVYYDKVIELFEKPIDINRSRASLSTIDLMLSDKDNDTKQLVVKHSCFGSLCELYFKATELGLDLVFSESIVEIFEYFFGDILSIYEKYCAEIKKIKSTNMREKEKQKDIEILSYKFKSEVLEDIPDVVNTTVSGFIEFAYKQLSENLFRSL